MLKLIIKNRKDLVQQPVQVQKVLFKFKIIKIIIYYKIFNYSIIIILVGVESANNNNNGNACKDLCPTNLGYYLFILLIFFNHFYFFFLVINSNRICKGNNKYNI